MKTSERLRFSIRKNDRVQVIAGREKGKTGKVLNVDSKTGRVTVEKLNLVKRHVKPSQKNPGGGIIQKELALHYSNVLLFCPKCNRGVRHGVKVIEAAAPKKGKKGADVPVETKKRLAKTRVCKGCGESLQSA